MCLHNSCNLSIHFDTIDTKELVETEVARVLLVELCQTNIIITRYIRNVIPVPRVDGMNPSLF